MFQNTASLFSHTDRQNRSTRLAFESLEKRELLATLAAPPVELIGATFAEVAVAEPQTVAVAEPQHAVASFDAGHKVVARHHASHTVFLPAGSNDGLAAAIAEAGPGGTVLVESGLHEESAAVIVDISVNIIGEPGAIVRVKTELSGGFGEAALLIQGADHTLVEGISLEGASDEGNVAIRIVDSHHVTVRNNVITDHLFGVAIESGDYAEIRGNEIIGLPDTEFFKIGIVNSNGTHTRIIGNEVSGFNTGIFAAGIKGHLQFNSVHDNDTGILLCQTPVADSPATRWHVANNNAYDNVFWGYAVTDFATNNFLVNNAASNNGVDVEDGADILLDGDPFPPSIETLVAVGSHKGLDVLDFGIDNKVNGG
jgi:hypothetical protein